ncbi:ABC transporter ATP-binding protein [Candidatus Viridilinea mediisalina]|uniref:Multidrug ABC transporter ATP-binding protein n=1 Tax=Candidatus Viridilinea mediisalina TaxID=2024553 RepID=A0A2A6RNV6_9CHLR|nr:ABC transporter ATP-binding protein [Candidatus Viridilinea mediisalina]PDW04784.1 multidrug ABC transporter ATP-binding protein [Candidatus Viridilinea mediisalina]
MTILVETKGLTHSYGGMVALNQLDLTIPQGAVYGFIGPNGAGKTTTMRILTTLLKPIAGEAFVAGYSVLKERKAVRRAVGFMPDFFGVYDNMTALEYLEFFAAAYEVPVERRERLIDDLLALVDLSHKKQADVMGLSRGMKQRLSLARTMLHDPALLILDEPASGLDPRARVELRELLKELRSMGKTIMISSHILTELAEMSTHIGIIERGNLIASNDVATILRSLQPHRCYELQLIPTADQSYDDALSAATALVSDQPHVLGVRSLPEAQPPHLQIDFDGDDHAISALLARLISNGIAVTHFAGQVNDLEDVFLRVTENLDYGGTA